MNALFLPFRSIDSWLDSTGMYRVVTITLLALAVVSILFGSFGLSNYTATEQLLSLLFAVGSALVINLLIARSTHIHANQESALITGLIIFFLFTPAFSFTDHYIVILASALAMTSKYLVVYKRQHIFNAAALGAVCLSFTGWHEAWWWIASPEMVLPLIIAGALVVQKIRRWPMVLTALAVGLAVVIIETVLTGSALTLDLLWRYSVTGPMLFLVFFMLTEPFTTPPTTRAQLGYAVIVATLVNTTLLAPYIAMTPELALVIGNLLAFPTTLRQKLLLTLTSKREIAAQTYELTFKKPQHIHFAPGQYLEWMLPHSPSDSRGIRRYFTIASAPEEETVLLALRADAGGSSYKRHLLSLPPGGQIIASQRAGNFLLQPNDSVKYGLIAGGIGITPFRSFVGHFIATNTKVDAILFYGNNESADIAYRTYFDEAAATTGLRTIHILSKEKTDDTEYGYFSEDILQRYAPDFLERYWYISGPPVMVRACEAILKKNGVPNKQIITDFFPGLA